MKRKEIKQLYEALKGLKLKDAPDNVMVPVYKNLMLLKPIVDEIETQNQLIADQNIDKNYNNAQAQYLSALQKLRDAKVKNDATAIAEAEDMLRLETELFKPIDIKTANNIQKHQLQVLGQDVNVNLTTVPRKALFEFLQQSGYEITGDKIVILLPIIKE